MRTCQEWGLQICNTREHKWREPMRGEEGHVVGGIRLLLELIERHWGKKNNDGRHRQWASKLLLFIVFSFVCATRFTEENPVEVKMYNNWGLLWWNPAVVNLEHYWSSAGPIRRASAEAGSCLLNWTNIHVNASSCFFKLWEKLLETDQRQRGSDVKQERRRSINLSAAACSQIPAPSHQPPTLGLTGR